MSDLLRVRMKLVKAGISKMDDKLTAGLRKQIELLELTNKHIAERMKGMLCSHRLAIPRTAASTERLRFTVGGLELLLAKPGMVDDVQLERYGVVDKETFING